MAEHREIELSPTIHPTIDLKYLMQKLPGLAIKVVIQIPESQERKRLLMVLATKS